MKSANVPHPQAEWTTSGLVSHRKFADWIECFQISRAEEASKAKERDGITQQSCKEKMPPGWGTGSPSAVSWVSLWVLCTWQTPQGKEDTEQNYEWARERPSCSESVRWEMFVWLPLPIWEPWQEWQCIGLIAQNSTCWPDRPCTTQ